MHGFKQGWIPLLGGIFSGLSINAQAPGSPITFEFAGEVTLVSDRNDVLPDTIALGSLITGAYTFESSTPDTGPGEPGRAFYNDAILDVTGAIADFAFSGPSEFGNFIFTLLDSFPGSGGDQYSVRAGIELFNEPVRFRLTLVDGTGLALLDESLPVVPPDLASYGRATFNIFSEADDFPFSVGGNLTALVPEPMTLVLLGIGAAFLVTRRARHAQRVPTRVRECSTSN